MKTPSKKISNNKTDKKKVKYFAVDKFVDDVIFAMDLGDASAFNLVEIKNIIGQRLGDRILFTVLNNFQEREFDMLENMIKDHPELDDLDALWLVAHEVDGLRDKLIREINSLFAELTYDAEQISYSLNNKKNG